jgi:hypothetical protein
MILLTLKDCPFCEDAEELVSTIPNIAHYEVENGFINTENGKIPLGRPLPGYPALINENHIYCGKKYILEFLDSIKERS